jgi:TonB family protein
MRYPYLVPEGSSAPDWTKPAPTEQLPKWEAAPWGQQELPSDLALDLRLHEILEEARLATAATGAVIALSRGDEMVCRATSGDKAPGLGVCLNTDSGLSGACVQTGKTQRCDDTLDDPRVNASACRDLEIRSILVLPVMDGEELLGIFEVFSSVPCAFTETDVQALQALCRRICHTVQEAAEGATPAPGPNQSSPEPEATPPRPEVVTRKVVRTSEPPDAVPPRRDYWTAALTASVIVLAVLLGWMLGRAGWSLHHAQAPVPAAPKEAQAAVPLNPDLVSPAHAVEASTSPGEPPATTTLKASSKPAAKKAALAGASTGGLVIYEQGKVVFRMSPSDKMAAALTEPSDSPNAASEEGDSNSAADAQSLPPANNRYLLERVEPQYPEEARQQHIQGPVVLEALVGNDGSVRELRLISGDPHLVRAAEDAVRQWRFKPHLRKGRAVEFETRITVNFALP